MLCFQRSWWFASTVPTNHSKISQATLPPTLSSRAHRCQEKDEIQHFRPGGNHGCERFRSSNAAYLKCLKKCSPTLSGVLRGGEVSLSITKTTLQRFAKPFTWRKISYSLWPVGSVACWWRTTATSCPGDDVRMSVECGAALVSPWFSIKWSHIIPQNIGWHGNDSLFQPKSTHFYMLFSEVFSQVQPPTPYI